MAEMIWWCEVTELPYRCKYEIGISSAVAHDACGNRILSAPSELIDPANLDYEAAEQIMRSWLMEDNDIRLSSAVRSAVNAALDVGEPVEGEESA